MEKHKVSAQEGLNNTIRSIMSDKEKGVVLICTDRVTGIYMNGSKRDEIYWIVRILEKLFKLKRFQKCFMEALLIFMMRNSGSGVVCKQKN